MRVQASRIVLAAIMMMMITSGITGIAAAQSQAPQVAQQSNETATPTTTPTPTQTETPDQCNPSEAEQMDTARLFTREDTITTDQPGVIAGGFLPPTGLECDMVVRVTMQVPNNMYIQGTTRLGSGGAGIVSSEFTIPADTSGVESVRAEVYSSETGQLPVTADISYWPEGYPDLERTISGLTLNFDVQQASQQTPTPPANTENPAQTPDDPGTESSSGIDPLIVAIAGLTIVGTAAAIGFQRFYISNN